MHFVKNCCDCVYSCSLCYSDVTEVPFQTLRDRGFRGVIFDKDNTLTVPHKLEIAPHLAPSLEECRRVFGDSGVVIFSNSAGSTDDKDGVEAKKIEEELQVAVLRHNQKKPGGITFVKKHFGEVDPQTLVVIGDRYSTDVLFGNLNGLLTIRTEQFTPESENVVNRQLQRIEKAAVRMLVRAGVKPPTHPLWKIIENKDDE
ncbi:HAD phosphatase, family IIIA, variant 1 [Phytophthora nicotianae CJ01A1]|uniref:HAD phosphatase, family IIIA, variant 1 n=5 Tax=Phytophthora nicotianae TaxID=4792 RepID=W2PYP4_PHYN3|nr:HAD phosphatase, family IIIA, variant 1 [Phytophthora nicotianae INRA-310]ETI40492.1 HAD phosphatase, family IIIA, variant 1 [Phytophthora nicotianae P1569]ETL87293.1 HAD phosphatase, family IIIA, variant 1 [Phytophthora nicotianae]ETO69225.1 HAD phosphatase, family IIIA, variant 1 [Phytophthora nicotianae P1976]ETP10268.1 HAD phosphatase, family IIIA, variant 1 [Phytophthora nicotianae CJ01A1]ETM40519.1 HAD phosphatase, family IIIA, variant 1 [Phytophthora nicotianae]